MQSLSKPQAQKISEITSSIFQQGTTWVMQEIDLETGLTKLTRGLSEEGARRKLKVWRRERTEELLRANRDQQAFTLRMWQENPSWQGQGIWHWVHSYWYTTREDAEKALEKKTKKLNAKCEIFQSTVDMIPGHFIVA